MKKYTDKGKKDTRSGFGAGLLEAGRADSRVVALTADLKGSLKMDAFAAEFPERYYECGIAEANMIGVASGMALAGKLDNRKSKVYVLLGDGEIQEGIVWEAAMSAAHYKLDNLVAILDNNGLQIDGRNDDVMKVAPLYEKFESFGWEVMETDGHDIEEIAEKLDAADEVEGKPVMIIARTVKGKGVSFMEDEAGWHGKAPNEEQTKIAIAELGGEQ